MTTGNDGSRSGSGTAGGCPVHPGGSGRKPPLRRLRDGVLSLLGRPGSRPPTNGDAREEPPGVGDADDPLRVEFHTRYDDLTDEKTLPRRPEKPEWWKRTGITSEETADPGLTDPPTVRACPSFQTMLSTGFVVPFWSDFRITVHADGTVEGAASDERFDVTWHDRNQLGKLADHLVEQGYAPYSIKFNCPWTVNTETGVASRVTDPPFAVGRPVRVVEGVVNTGYFPHMQINTFFRLPEGEESVTHVFERGEPFFKVVPFVRASTEKDVRVRDEEFWETYDRSFPNTVTRFRHALEYRELDPLDSTHAETEPMYEVGSGDD